MKQSLLLSVLLLFCISIFGQNNTTVSFKFKADENGFFANYRGNRTQLDELYKCIDLYKSDIVSGKLPIHVTGYGADIKISSVRLNRVKSEMISQKGLTESNFVSSVRGTSYEGANNIVVVTLTIPAITVEPRPVEPPKPPKPPVIVEDKQPEPPKPIVVEEKQPKPEVVEKFVDYSKQSVYCFAISSNLLYDLALAPNLGIEWKPSDRFGILVNGAWSGWEFNGGDKLHKMWMISPELRYYIGHKKRLYTGAMFHTGEFNMKFNNTGYQGEFMGGGLLIGYMLHLTDAFNLDLGIALGGTHGKYDSYRIDKSYNPDGVKVYEQKDASKNIWGPTKAGVTLVWKIK